MKLLCREAIYVIAEELTEMDRDQRISQKVSSQRLAAFTDSGSPAAESPCNELKLILLLNVDSTFGRI
jgi:hypothetical protein